MRRRKSSTIVVAIDCNGGDNAPFSVINAIDLVLAKTQDVFFLLFGVEKTLAPLIKKNIKDYVEIKHTEGVILSTDKPSSALRKKSSSIHAAVKAVKNGDADCAISAGNTGALMAIAKLTLGMLPGIRRPAIVTTLPGRNKEVVFLDLGANIECDGEILYQFAAMGKIFAETVCKRQNPIIALLNIGSEEVKGTENVKEAFNLLKNSEQSINFAGYIEPNKMLQGCVDVVVTDGFCGNIMLKTAEGVFQFMKGSIIDSCKESFFSTIKLLLVKYLLKKTAQHCSPTQRNGAMLIGLNGIVIKSHGNADAKAFSAALQVAISAARNNINSQILN